MLTVVVTFGQKSNDIALISSPGAYDDGFNIGAQFVHSNRTVYVGPEVFIFPNLNSDKFDKDLTYVHGIVRLGLNIKLQSRVFNEFRLFSGGRAGTIFRDSRFHAILGLEAGAQYTIGNKFFIKGAFVIDSRTDSTIWNEDNFQVISGIAGIGIKL